ncbi:hypothetical protein BGP89_04545 [Luteimonas sp. JM171]|uniref:hypothetical protein n=1 Tax=Luteimonas sp. JM171 TaxID=1896164 RepID=UPI0008573E6C|nr:hypothetical protein [Luteimonas sp. JM171]AOH35717.1 hypothetical protein BGP89_04545 [Luteimonas sp. JM171]
MNRLEHFQDKATQLAGQIGDNVRHVPDHARRWFKAGVAVGAARAGGRAVIKSTREHPAISAGAAAALMAVAAGLVVYAYRRRRETSGEAIEGSARRIGGARRSRPPREQDMRGPVEAHGGDEGA